MYERNILTAGRQAGRQAGRVTPALLCCPKPHIN